MRSIIGKVYKCFTHFYTEIHSDITVGKKIWIIWYKDLRLSAILKIGYYSFLDVEFVE